MRWTTQKNVWRPDKTWNLHDGLRRQLRKTLIAITSENVIAEAKHSKRISKSLFASIKTICFLVTGCLWPQQGVTGVFHEHHDCAGNYSKCRSFFKWKPITFQSRQSLMFPWGFLCWAISNPLTTFCFTWQPGNLAGSWVWMDFGWFWPSFSTFPYFSHR